jgi:uncharacterized protein (TIGR02246 family)
MPAAKDDLVRLETRFWQAMVDKDPDAALKLVNDPCIVTGAQGVARIGKDKFAQLMKGGEWTLHKFELSDVEVQQLTDDVAVIGYKVREELTVGGDKVVMEAADASTWVKANGGWLCAMHTESLIGDPYGRDRKASGG